MSLKSIYFRMTKIVKYFSLYIVSWILRSIKFIQISLERVRNKLTENHSNKSNFHTLTPIVDIENKTINYYIESLQWAVKNDDCYNIALMGIYGSGKSSIIKSFLNKHIYYKSVVVSLANFQKKNPDINQLEKSIVQQIFYTVKESKLPNSGIKRIRSHTRAGSILFYFNLVFSVLLFLILFKPEILCFFNQDYLYDNYLHQTQLISSVFLLIIGFFYFKKYRYLAHQIGVKLNLQNAEISLPNSKDKSVINKYLDELIYFFEKNHRDIIVFEDLDRFNEIEVFSKLRELNLLLNNHEVIKRKGKITFIYAVKDDLFGDDATNIKTKFFDFILPVISVMNSSNSFAQFKLLLQESQFIELSEEFLKNISLYINDLRILKNICNEYSVYKKLINDIPEIGYSSDSFLAMIIYKNYYPSDFNKLLMDNGQLFNILSKEYKQNLIASYSVEIKKQISDVDNQINKLKTESSPTLRRISELNDTKKGLEKVNVNLMPLSELASKNGLTDFSQKTLRNQDDKTKLELTIVHDELIQYLLKNGFIDENYQLYISHYIEGGLSKNDRTFLLNVNEERIQKLDYDFKLSFISELISRIHRNKFSKIQILNYSLIDFILEKNNTEIKHEIFTSLSKLLPKHLNFIEQYYLRGIKSTELITEIIVVNKVFLNRLIDSMLEIGLKSKIIFDYLLETSDTNVTKALLDNSKLSGFISNSEFLLNTDYVKVESLVELMVGFKNIKFKTLSYNIENDRLKAINDSSLFEVTLNNITIIYNRFYNPNSKDTKEDISPVFTNLSMNWESSSLTYIVNNENFVQNIYSSNIIHDEIEEYLLILIEIINETEDSEEKLLTLLFNKTSTIISDIDSISNIEIQKYLIEKNRILFNWSNIISYQNNQSEEPLLELEVGDELIDFIEMNMESQSLNFNKEEIDDIPMEELFNFKLIILKDDRFDISIFEMMIKTIEDLEIINQVQLSDWNYGQIKALIQNNKIELSNEWIEHLKQVEFTDLIVDLYISDISELLENYESYNISIDELSKIITSNKLEKAYKIRLFFKYDFNIHNNTNKIPESILSFSDKYFKEILFYYEPMLSILKNTESKNQSLTKRFAIKMINKVHTNEKIKQIIKALEIREFNSLWDYSSNMQDFYNTKENNEIFRLLAEKRLVGAIKTRKKDGKILVFKLKHT